MQDGAHGNVQAGKRNLRALAGEAAHPDHVLRSQDLDQSA
jgi:hypothetical protein